MRPSTSPGRARAQRVGKTVVPRPGGEHVDGAIVALVARVQHVVGAERHRAEVADLVVAPGEHLEQRAWLVGPGEQLVLGEDRHERQRAGDEFVDRRPVGILGLVPGNGRSELTHPRRHLGLGALDVRAIEAAVAHGPRRRGHRRETPPGRLDQSVERVAQPWITVGRLRRQVVEQGEHHGNLLVLALLGDEQSQQGRFEWRAGHQLLDAVVVHGAPQPVGVPARQALVLDVERAEERVEVLARAAPPRRPRRPERAARER